jgi:glutamyl-tRNA(Gln) amidotransferase subunit E
MDYQKLGLKCGLEIHQQLNTKKLFCNCPSALCDDDPDFNIKRQLRAVAGEGGEIDVAALHEQLKSKQFVYGAFHDGTCLVELDEEPPHPLNKEALNATLQTALIFKTKIVDTIQVMRKTVIDGSNTSGFQRTALIAYNGILETASGSVKIDTICLEEDSARHIKESGETRTYRLDRLGIPLIEIATGPDITTPQQCREAAEQIGMILRSTGKVKRGIGTIRQDVNVSIREGTRIEIKGAQDLKQIPKLVEYEAQRQANLITIKKELRKRKTNLNKHVDVSKTLKQSDSQIIKNTLKNKGIILAAKLSGFNELLGRETQPNKRLGTELSERAKVKAGVGGIFHSDELPAYGITEQEINIITNTLACKKEDAFILVAAQKSQAEKAIVAAIERAKEAIDGIPSEVRKANQDGTTSYLRPMPGAARMYPETDIPLIKPHIKDIKLPELIDQKIQRFIKKFNLSKDLATLIAKSSRAELFEELASKYTKVKPAFIAETLTAGIAELSKEHNLSRLTDNKLRELFSHLDKGNINKDTFLSAVIETAKGTFNIQKSKTLTNKQLKEELTKIINKNKKAPFGAIMGMAVKQLKGKASGQEIAKVLKQYLK